MGIRLWSDSKVMFCTLKNLALILKVNKLQINTELEVDLK